MSLEPPAIRLVREALEERLPERDAASALFHALAEWGPRVPTDHREILQLVKGPLRRALGHKLGPTEASAVLDWVSAIVINSEEPTGSHHTLPEPSHPPQVKAPPGHIAESEDPAFWSEDQITETVSTTSIGVVRMAVLSATHAFADHLRLTLGPERIHVTTATKVGDLRAVLEDHTLDFVLVDGGLPPPSIPVGTLANALKKIPRGVWRTIWGADLDYGRVLSRALLDEGLHCIPLAIDDGIAPLVDLIRSRGASTTPGA